ncbi:MAG: hypothetical protein JJU02_16430 [Cryomorphaceae bacterium]|nr:hypothetical protein [Cryomorphaceae bacterium]
MDVILEILKYALPSIFLLILAYMMLSNFMENEEKRRAYFIRKETQKSALPARLAAYERLALFLERITPSQLIVRESSKGLNVRQYQGVLVKAIRNEFEHNVSQQIYISEHAWRYVVTSKSAIVGIINQLAGELEPGEPGIELGKKVLNHFMEMDLEPSRKAIAYLKNEIARELLP